MALDKDFAEKVSPSLIQSSRLFALQIETVASELSNDSHQKFYLLHEFCSLISAGLIGSIVNNRLPGVDAKEVLEELTDAMKNKIINMVTSYLEFKDRTIQ